ncbi:helix-turn-helix domain-containing protein [Paenibacillus sp. 32352]|uniref:helix-turn-helix domain-containing protein n=1 Tax=Paenibacillus sp. 32352 TaxID=1969111 RepID=UPI0009AE4460|nr:helix-turn-helix domain-containing protein [Paenibacillus sp. 32352]
MKYLTSLESFIFHKLGRIAYQVWYGQHNALDLVLSGDKELEMQTHPFPVSKEQQYQFTYQPDISYMNITFDDEVQMVVYFANSDTRLDELELQQLHLLCRDYHHQMLLTTKDLELDKMIEGIGALTSTLDLNKLLQQIIRSALTVISAGDAGIFRLYDSQSSLLNPLAAIGFDDSIAQYKTRSGEAISGKVFSDGIPRIYHSRQEMEADYTNISSQNANFVQTSDKANALIIVPVSSGDTRIGTLTLLQFHKKRNFTHRDIKLLQGFASQVAIAIHNAKLYEETHLRLQQVTALSKKLEDNNLLLQKRINVHDTLTQLSLKNKGIQKMIHEINLILGMPVAYIDFLDNAIYKEHESKVPVSFDMISELFANQQQLSPLSIKIMNQDYFLYPITVGKVLLGCILVTVSHPLSPMDIITVEQSGSVLALEIVKKISVTELQYKKADDFFNQILNMQNHEQIIAKGRQFNLTFSSYSFIVICEIPELTEPYEVEAKIQRFISRLNKELVQVNKLIYGDYNKVKFLVSVHDPAEVDKTIHLISNVIKEWEKTDQLLLRGGIGSAYQDLEDISKSYNEANKTVAFARSKNNYGLMRYEEIGINRFFLNQPIQEIEKYINEIFAPLRTDKNQSKELEKTLMLYISLNQSAVETARKLHIHVNSFYQRMKRIEELLDLSLDDPEDMLKIQLACHLKNTFV